MSAVLDFRGMKRPDNVKVLIIFEIFNNDKLNCYMNAFYLRFQVIFGYKLYLAV